VNNFLLIIFALALVLAVAAGVLLVYFKPRKKGVDQKNFDKMWSHVNELINSDDQHKHIQAVVEADKLMDFVLKKKVKGEDLGGRLRNAKRILSSDGYNQVWESHKLRNQLVHEVGIQVSPGRCRKAVVGFARGFKDMGYKVRLN